MHGNKAVPMKAVAAYCRSDRQRHEGLSATPQCIFVSPSLFRYMHGDAPILSFFSVEDLRGERGGTDVDVELSVAVNWMVGIL